jgi:ABC-type antimicrobial peptide transport system permease subunit
LGDAGESAILHVRAEGPAAGVVGPVRELLARLAPGLPIYEVTTLKQDVEASIATERSLGRVTVGFGAAAAAILAAGLFALLSFVVAQRSREIGIRFALGARAADIVTIICGRLLIAILAGAAGGVALSLVATRVFAAVLYGVAASDPRPVGGAVMLILAVAALAAVVPAMRALRIAPAAALRDE